jgi:ubiquitin carboxyl-terminal hydrolase 22/27/51
MNSKTGILNIGNTCYLNSSLQLFINCSVFSKFVLQNKFHDTTLDTYQTFLEDYNKNNIANAVNIKKIVAIKNDQFMGSAQNDAAEFITALLDILDTALQAESKYLKKKNKSYCAGKIPIGKLVPNLFGCKIVSTLLCGQCGYKSDKTDTENILTLHIPKDKQAITLYDCMNAFVASEKLDIKNMWQCDGCKNMVKANKQLSLKSCPKYMILHMKRFGTDPTNNTPFKRNDKIDMPYEFPLHDNNYILRGFILHSGGVKGGHYTCYNRCNEKWYCFDDRSVYIVDDNDIERIMSVAYIYLYVKKRQPI